MANLCLVLLRQHQVLTSCIREHSLLNQEQIYSIFVSIDIMLSGMVLML